MQTVRQSHYYNIMKVIYCGISTGYGFGVILNMNSSVGIATRYGLEGSWDLIPVGGEIFRTYPDRPWFPPSLLYNGYRVFPRGKTGSGVTLTTHPI